MYSASVDISNKRTQDRLQELAGDVMSEITKLDPSHSKELLSKLKYITQAGKMRFDSVYHGLCAIPAAETDTVIIMTAVCPLLSQETIDKHYANMGR